MFMEICNNIASSQFIIAYKEELECTKTKTPKCMRRLYVILAGLALAMSQHPASHPLAANPPFTPVCGQL